MTLAVSTAARSTIHGAHSAAGQQSRRGFNSATPLTVAGMSIALGMLGGLVWAAHVDAAALGGFNYGFGHDACGEFTECGNGAFDAYAEARGIALVAFILVMVAIAANDVVRGSLANRRRADTKTIPAMLKYSVVAFAFLFILPPVWDMATAGITAVGG